MLDRRKSALEGTLYKSTLRRFFPVLAVGIGASVSLVVQGLHGLKSYPAVAEDPFRFIAGFLPLIVAGCIFVGMGYIVYVNYNKRIGITTRFVLYKVGLGKTKRLPWNRISISVPCEHRPGMFSKANITDGRHNYPIEKFFFDDYQEICSELKDTRDRFKKGEFDE